MDSKLTQKGWMSVVIWLGLLGGTAYTSNATVNVFNAIIQAFDPTAPIVSVKAPRKDHAPAPVQGLAGARLLVVEDNAINQQVAREILEGAGCRVDLAHNGQEALAALEVRSYDAVLMDIQMPVMDGYEATRRIRQELGRHSLPILAMTAHAVSEERDKCFRMGMDDHIAKPVSRRSLFAALNCWIRERPVRARAR